MSEENSNEKTTNDDEVPHDWFLASLINLANRFGIQMGVTISVGGALISGELVSGKRYFEEVARAIRDNFPADLAELGSGLSAAIKEHGEVYQLYTPPVEANDAEDGKADSTSGEEPSPVSFIHLRNANFFLANGSPITGGGGVFWRGRLECVDGFSLGVIRSSAP